MKVAGFAGYSGSGKTTLIERLIPALKQRGLRVSVVKHAHHKFDIDTPGKDTFRHRKAGAFEVVAASSRRMALMREFDGSAEPGVHELLAELDTGVDWVLVEGFKQSDLPKIEVLRAALAGDPEKPVHHVNDPFVLAIATDDRSGLPQPVRLPVLDLNDADGVAQYLMDHAEQFEYRPEPATKAVL